MKIKNKKFKGVFEITLDAHEDNRGFFMRIYDKKIFSEYNLDREWVQENQSHSAKKGTIRGLHFQIPPYSETKLVRVINGEVFFIVVDLRKNSPTFGKQDSIIVSAQKRNMLWVGKGFALGMCTLTDNSDLVYKMDNYYAPDKSGTIRWNDIELKIAWPLKNVPIISEKDAKAQEFREFVKVYGGLSE